MSKPKQPIAIYYEHPHWFLPLFAELERRGTPFVKINAAQHHFDPSQLNGPAYNPPRFAEYGGLRGPERVKTSANNSIFDVGNPLTISKPNGGRK